MAHWLLKTEPESYSFADLEVDGKAVWDGVTNALALKNLRLIKKGDSAFIYHTGGERQIAGIATALCDAYADPRQKDTKLAVVDLAPYRRLTRPVTLSEIKSDRAFAGWDLLRLSRLSVMAVSPLHWQRILQISGSA